MGNQPEARATRVRWVVMGFLCVLSFLTYYDRICLIRAQEDVQRSLHLDEAQWSWILGAFWLAYALFEIPAGWTGDRYGARIALTRIVLAWSLFTMLSGMATGFYSLIIYRFMFGMGEAGAYPNMARVQGAWLPKSSRARAGGLLWLMARWGGAFSPLIFGAFLRLFSGKPLGIEAWRWALYVAGLAGVAWTICFWFFFRDSPQQKPSVNQAEIDLIHAGGAAAPPRHSMSKSAWKALFTSRSLLAMGFLYFFASFSWSFFASWVSKYLKQTHGIELSKSELYTGMPLFFGGISCLVGGALCDWAIKRTGKKRLMRALFPVAGYLTAALAMFAMRGVKTPAAAITLMCIASAANDFGQGANWATIVDVGGIYAGVAAGLINMVGNQANFIGPVTSRTVFAHYGWDALFALYATTYIAAAAMWLLINPNKVFYEERPSEN